MDTKSGYVYIIQMIEQEEKMSKRYKIGRSKHVNRRVGELQTGNPDELIVTKDFFCKQVHKLENIVHKEYEQYNTRGEWFCFTNDELLSCIEFIEKEILKINSGYYTCGNKGSNEINNDDIKKKNKESYKYQCEQCLYGTNDKSNFNKHIGSKHHTKKNDKNKKIKQTEYEYRCPDCSKKLSSASSFYRHKREYCKITFIKIQVEKELEERVNEKLKTKQLELELKYAKMELNNSLQRLNDTINQHRLICNLTDDE